MRLLMLVSLAALQGPMATSTVTPPVPAHREGCTISDGGDGCSNLLPADWAGRRGGDLGALVERLRAMPMQGATVVQQRKSNCAEGTTVELMAPQAMLEFPDDGTKGRQVVSHVLRITGDGDCAESRYGVAKRRNGWNSVIQFIAVSTNDARGGGRGADRDIGTWQAFSIDERDGDYRVSVLRRGRFVLCGQPHAGPDQVAFIGCEGGRAAHDAARSGLVGSALDAALDRVHHGGPNSAMAALGFDPESDPVWARCGNLGCCAAY